MLRAARDFEAFERVMLEAHRRFPLRLCAYCVMPNHWHFVPWPERDGEMTDFFRWLAHTHAMRWRVAHHTVGYGHLYQGRFKSFPVEGGDPLSTVLRYVERNPVRAGLVRLAQRWRWGSCHVRAAGRPELAELAALLSEWPIDRRRDWLEWVNAPQTAAEEEAVRLSLRRDRPFGGEAWVGRTAQRLGLGHTLRPRGRPKGWRKTKGPGAEPK